MNEPIRLEVVAIDETNTATATIHMPGQEPLRVATLLGGFASGPEVVEAWKNFLKFGLSRFLIDQGMQIKQITETKGE